MDMPSWMLFFLLVSRGICQDQQVVVPQPGGTTVHIATCALVEPRDLTPEERERKLRGVEKQG